MLVVLNFIFDFQMIESRNAEGNYDTNLKLKAEVDDFDAFYITIAGFLSVGNPLS